MVYVGTYVCMRHWEILRYLTAVSRVGTPCSGAPRLKLSAARRPAALDKVKTPCPDACLVAPVKSTVQTVRVYLSRVVETQNRSSYNIFFSRAAVTYSVLPSCVFCRDDGRFPIDVCRCPSAQRLQAILTAVEICRT